jgi:thioredoxin 1|tara:strand:- start:1265 stop:1579 length:315 start_codon:yes stop_codon:yes gene_type:complete
MAKEFTDANFAQEVVATGGLAVVDFWAEWCGPCRMVGPIIEQLAEENPDINIGKVNVDENNELAAKFGIRSIPTILILRDGEVIDKVSGVKPIGEFQELLAKHS